MKYLALIAVLFAAPAFAQEANVSTEPHTVTVPSPATPAPAPAQPTVWAWTDMDAGDLNNQNACAVELPKKIADQWINRLSQHIKPVK